MNPRILKQILQMLICLILMVGLCTDLLHTCTTFGRVMNLKPDTAPTAHFRRQHLSTEALEKLAETAVETNLSKGTVLSVWMPMKKFKLTDGTSLTAENCKKWGAYFLKHRRKEFEELQKLYAAVWDDLVYFPAGKEITYEDSWMFERSYGGKRRHEGCDLMPPENESGVYPIFSMTDGIVENIGWLDKGGWRIGIRSPHGGYFYYAHLSDYASGFQVGQKIHAGDIIGYMGDTGYGPEGTRGKFDVHLHLGIYVRTEKHPEISVNPYWILRSLESRRLTYHLSET